MKMIGELVDLSEKAIIDKLKNEFWESVTIQCVSSEVICCSKRCLSPCEKAEETLIIMAYFELKQVAKYN